MSYTTTVTGSYPRKEVQKDTLRKPSVSEEESFEMIKWAVKEQSDLGLGTPGRCQRVPRAHGRGPISPAAICPLQLACGQILRADLALPRPPQRGKAMKPRIPSERSRE